MANQDIFGIEKKKKKPSAGMVSEYGEELIGQKIASGEIAKESGEGVARSMAKNGVKPAGGVREKNTERDDFGNLIGDKKRAPEPTPNTEEKAEPAPAKKTFGEGLKDGLKQAFSDPFGIGALKKKKEK